MTSLFSTNKENHSPLAFSLRPKNFDDFVGQEHILSKNSPLRKMIEDDNMSCLIFWWPPWTWKTSLAHIISNTTWCHFIKFSAVEQWVKDIKDVAKLARNKQEYEGIRTILFVDEIHRLNKSQQDAFLPHTENWTFILIWATTENPSFYVNSALLSRSQTFGLKSLKPEDLTKMLKKAEASLSINLDTESEEILINYCSGDWRKLLNLVEVVHKHCKSWKIAKKDVIKILWDKAINYDKKWEMHYDCISAFIKSMRWSDENAAVYYLARMIEGWEDPRFIARRMMIFASEDIWIADSKASLLAASTYQAAEKIGMPEVRIILSHTAIYLSKCPKDNRSYLAIDKALAEVKQSWDLDVPMQLRNAPTDFMKKEGYGKWYEYAHNLDDKKPSHDHLPEKIKDIRFFD